ncbi:low molecular weight phosphatase family protein [Corynebacterium sp. H127]|uniref:arsenate reductase/protein-tyrosine-phosphatase family protein n=1 Tax=Corynebacterium sp. H127 TaxID=3133418 RepID=UPI00309E0D52
MSDQFRILTICTGNVCRSPLAKLLLQKHLAEFSFIKVDSAGVAAMRSHPMPPNSLMIAEQLNLDGSELHRARQLSDEDLANADLILAMDRTHRRSVVEQSPRSARRVFTVRELARLVEVAKFEDFKEEIGNRDLCDAELLRTAIGVAQFGRSELSPFDHPEDEDVIDPIGGPEGKFIQSAEQLVPAIDAISRYFKATLKQFGGETIYRD